MRLPAPAPLAIALCLLALALLAAAALPFPLRAQQSAPGPTQTQQARADSPQNYAGFDANDYPGDDLLPALRQRFAFTGYWLNNPPGADHNPWAGKRDTLVRAGFGFLVVANGRLDAEILKAQRAGTTPAAFARQDAAAAIAAARRDGFPPGTILFLDQEEGGRMLDEQAAYLLAWTQAVAASAYLPGVYASGQPVNDGRGPDGRSVTITTIQDIREHIAAQHLHSIAFWVYNDACPPANGCTLPPPPANASGTPAADAWQFAQSPRRRAITQACAASYRGNSSCTFPGLANLPLDLSVSASPDPSHGR